MRRGGPYRPWLAIAGVVAGLALILRGALDWQRGPGWPLVLVGVVVLIAVALRRFVFRD